MPSLMCSSICSWWRIWNCCDLSFLPAWPRTVLKQSVFISRSILACDHFILAHWSFQTAPDNGTDTELGHSWLLDPLHLQQESHCDYKVVPPRPPQRWTVNYWWGQRATSSMGFDNVCLQRRDLRGLAMHHCDTDSNAWFHCMLFEVDLWQEPNGKKMGHQ